jgi:hypothetical protein
MGLRADGFRWGYNSLAQHNLWTAQLGGGPELSCQKQGFELAILLKPSHTAFDVSNRDADQSHAPGFQLPICNH